MNPRLLVAGLLLASSWHVAAGDANSSGAPCGLTEPIPDEPPSDPHASSFGRGPWYINSNRTIWADPWHPWTASSKGVKVLWIRPAGEPLAVEGRRLDGAAPPLAALVPCCYPWTYQSTRLTFPSEGCWEIAATAGTEKLTFTVAVAAAPRAEARP